MPSTSVPAGDPRDTITPESFQIDPGLLGLPLARPLRRATAMLLDLLLVALLVNAGGVLFGLAAAWVFFRVSGKSSAGGLLRRSWRFAFRSLAAVVLFAVAASQWSALTDRFRSQPGERPVAQAAREGAVGGAEPRGESAAAPPLDSLLASFSAALESDDSAALAGLRPYLVQSLAADTLAVLQGRLQSADRERSRLAAQLSRAREQRGILSFLFNAADDLGLTFGWSGLYFTAFLVLWQGQTPGKRLMGIRVVRLDGKPMTWWSSFERFGGYAASIFTGLLGFVQIAWDRNRQGMHDKISETVVVRLSPR